MKTIPLFRDVEKVPVNTNNGPAWGLKIRGKGVRSLVANYILEIPTEEFLDAQGYDEIRTRFVQLRRIIERGETYVIAEIES